MPALPEPFDIPPKPDVTIELSDLFAMDSITLVFRIVATLPILAQRVPGWPLLMFSVVVMLGLRLFVKGATARNRERVAAEREYEREERERERRNAREVRNEI
jgi:hypothetical protein